MTDVELRRPWWPGAGGAVRVAVREFAPDIVHFGCGRSLLWGGWLVRGESVKLSSFGSFSVREKGQRIGRNPKTGEEVPILPRRVLVFRASHVLKDRINRKTPSADGD